MDENQWLTGAWPKWMLEHVRARATPRKLRLFACASVRRIDALAGFAGQTALDTLQTAEAFAEGVRSHADFFNAVTAALDAFFWPQHGVPDNRTIGEIRTALQRLGASAPWDAAHAYVTLVPGNNSRQAELAAHADILRCLFGNPFRPVSLDPAWLVNNGGAATHLARVIAEEQRFADLPILADALEEAGCDQAAVLDHCRSAGTHVRGCWVLDLLLGRS